MNTQRIDEAKALMERGWKLREDRKFEEGEKLLHEAKEIFEEEEDWFNVTECLNHLSYSEKIKAAQSSLKGLSLAKESLKISEDHKTKRLLVLRALISLASSVGNFELAKKYTQEAMLGFDESVAKADIMSHLATFELRTGHINEAKQTADQALALLEKHWDTEKEPHRSLWKCRALLAKAIILYNMGDSTQSKEIATEALKLATDGNLKSRIQEAEAFLELLN